MKNAFVFITAILLGILVAYIDTRPHWNDDGISVLMILLASTVCGYFSNKRPWLIAILVGIWVPVFNIIIAKNFGSLIAIVPAFIGAYAGYYLAKIKIAKV